MAKARRFAPEADIDLFAHEYKRHGTTTLFAALEVATGLVRLDIIVAAAALTRAGS